MDLGDVVCCDTVVSVPPAGLGEDIDMCGGTPVARATSSSFSSALVRMLARTYVLFLLHDECLAMLILTHVWTRDYTNHLVRASICNTCAHAVFGTCFETP